VIVNGKVLYRLPGQKAPADRQRVIDMIARDTPGPAQSGPMQIISQGWRPQDIPLWPEGDDAAEGTAISGELRVVGGLTLPHRILSRPWLGTPAKQAALDALNNAPLRSSPSWSLQPWLLTEARAGSLVEPEERGDPMSPLRWTTKSTRTLAGEGRSHPHAITQRRQPGVDHSALSFRAVRATLLA